MSELDVIMNFIEYNLYPFKYIIPALFIISVARIIDSKIDRDKGWNAFK